VQKNKNKMLTPLLADLKIQQFDIIAIQEPWKNPKINTSYNPVTSGFHLAYINSPDTRACLYISKKFDANR